MGPEIACFDIFQTSGAGVEGDQDDIAVRAIGDTSVVHSGHSAECFVIILADNNIELSLIGLAEGLHDFLAAGLGEVTGLLVKDGPSFSVSDFLEALGTSDLSGRTGGSGDDQSIDLVDALRFCIGLQPLAGRKTFCLEVGADP